MESSNSGIPSFKLAPYRGLSDFTVYVGKPSSGVPKDETVAAIEKLLAEKAQQSGSRQNQQWSPPHSVHSYPDSIKLDDGSNFEEFRSLICSCFRNEHYSLTLRSTSSRKPWGKETDSPKSLFSKSQHSSNYDPNVTIAGEAPEDLAKFLFKWNEYCQVLSEKILPGKDPKHGLVIVAGATAAGKSKIIRGLIHGYLNKRIDSQDKPNDRRPHLLTFEDPIETRYFDSPEIAQQTGLDYTPRQKGIDVRNLRQLFEDSLRQTPAAVYIGETRRSEDWEDLVDFAGKGHLVFTTCHAGSLTEVISAIRTATRSSTAAARSALASRLLAVVHLRAEKIGGTDDKDLRKGALLPALWLRTPAGVNFFTADGLSAVLPHSAAGDANPDARYCFGRGYFARVLVEKAIASADSRADEVLRYTNHLRQKAVELDLEGL